MNDPQTHREAASDQTHPTLRDSEHFSQTVDANFPPSVETPPDLDVGHQLGKYEIRKKLGQGGMGAVYLAFDPMIAREVAIKVLPPNVAGQPRALERFLSEARALPAHAAAWGTTARSS